MTTVPWCSVLHIVATDGCFAGNGNFITGPEPDPKELEAAFRWEVLKLLKDAGKINDFVIENMMGWYHSGFNVYCGTVINPFDQEGLERLAQYIIRAPISQERMACVPASESFDGVARVIYKAKDGRTTKTFPAMDWLAHLDRLITAMDAPVLTSAGSVSHKQAVARAEGEYEKHLQRPDLRPSDVERAYLDSMKRVQHQLEGSRSDEPD